MAAKKAAGEKPSGSKGRGQPTKFTDEVTENAFALADAGKTDVEIADILGISVATVYRWKIAHPEFCEALKAGKAVADSRVTVSLYQRACGYSHPDVHISNFQGEITVTPIIKYFPPDTTACIFWLKNRQPEEWRDKVESAITHSGEIKIVVGGDT